MDNMEQRVIDEASGGNIWVVFSFVSLMVLREAIPLLLKRDRDPAKALKSTVEDITHIVTILDAMSLQVIDIKTQISEIKGMLSR